MAKIKDCAHCGGRSVLTHDQRQDGNCWYKVAYIHCTECGVRTCDYIIDGYYGSDDSEQDAIDAWNKRSYE